MRSFILILAAAFFVVLFTRDQVKAQRFETKYPASIIEEPEPSGPDFAGNSRPDVVTIDSNSINIFEINGEYYRRFKGDDRLEKLEICNDSTNFDESPKYQLEKQSKSIEIRDLEENTDLDDKPIQPNLEDPGQSSITTVLFSETFEGDFPGSVWDVGDSNPEGGEDYWDDLSCGNPGQGSWHAWCADIGDQQDCVSYDNYMNSSMATSDWINIAGYNNIQWRFLIKWNLEVTGGIAYDSASILINTGSSWYTLAVFTGNNNYWPNYEQMTIGINTSSILLKIRYRIWTDYSITEEGVYVDDVVITGDPGGQEVLFTDHFEGNFPGNTWTAWDADPTGGEDYWDDVQCGNPCEGSQHIWCADNGEIGCTDYADYMQAWMVTTNWINVSGHENITWAYKMKWDLEPNYDFAYGVFQKASGGGWFHFVEDTVTGINSQWPGCATFIHNNMENYDLGGAIKIGFKMWSDYSVHDYEGVYVDNVNIFGNPNTGIEQPELAEPDEFLLLYNYPNPFNSQTIISYSLPTESFVKISVYDLLGRRIELLIDEDQEAGFYKVTWDGRDKASGMYFYKIQAGEIIETQKMLLLK